MLDALLFVALSQNGGFVKLNMIQYLKRRFVRNVREVETYHRNHTEAKQNAQVAGAEHEGMKKRISEMQQFLAEQQQDITEYDEQLVRRLIEKITVYDERVTVEFKSGTSVDVRR